MKLSLHGVCVALLASVSLSMSLSVSARAQNLLVNGSFELPGYGNPGQSMYLPDGSTYVTGWVSVDNVPDALRADNTYFHAPYFGNPASDGEYFIAIDNNSYPGPSENGVYQDFATTPGALYNVTFDAATEVSYGLPGHLKVTAGNTIMNYTLPNVNGLTGPGGETLAFTGWSTYGFSFTAQSTVSRLQFYDEGTQPGYSSVNGDASPFLDRVSVVANSTNAPEPGSLALLGFALINSAGTILTIRCQGNRFNEFYSPASGAR